MKATDFLPSFLRFGNSKKESVPVKLNNPTSKTAIIIIILVDSVLVVQSGLAVYQLMVEAQILIIGDQHKMPEVLH